jgi:hypothetical protein
MRNIMENKQEKVEKINCKIKGEVTRKECYDCFFEEMKGKFFSRPLCQIENVVNSKYPNQ